TAKANSVHRGRSIGLRRHHGTRGAVLAATNGGDVLNGLTLNGNLDLTGVAGWLARRSSSIPITLWHLPGWAMPRAAAWTSESPAQAVAVRLGEQERNERERKRQTPEGDPRPPFAPFTSYGLGCESRVDGNDFLPKKPPVGAPSARMSLEVTPTATPPCLVILTQSSSHCKWQETLMFANKPARLCCPKPILGCPGCADSRFRRGPTASDVHSRFWFMPVKPDSTSRTPRRY